MINKKMMLCAVVGGQKEDLDKMLEVRNIHMNFIQCEHIDGSTAYFELRQMAFERQMVGHVARCSLCGRIYYKEAEDNEVRQSLLEH
jgi:hypothetical protein